MRETVQSKYKAHLRSRLVFPLPVRGNVSTLPLGKGWPIRGLRMNPATVWYTSTRYRHVKGIACPKPPSSTLLGQIRVGSQPAMLDSLTLTGPCRSMSPRRWQDVKAKPAHIAGSSRVITTPPSPAPHLNGGYTILCSFCLTMRQGMSASRTELSVASASPGTLVPPSRNGHMWDNGLVPETLIFECPTAYVPCRNVPSAVRGRRYQPPVIL